MPRPIRSSFATRFGLLTTGLGLVVLAGCGPDPVDMGDGGPGGPLMCNAYEYRGMTYDCDALDRCNETDLTFRLACCECDPALCNPDPTCEDGGGVAPTDEAESCMECHNGSEYNDYAGDGMSNPHPFPGQPNIACTTCHGGDGNGAGRLGSHVPPPPEIGDDANLVNDPVAYFNRLSLSGIDKLPDYTVDGTTYTALEYLQFINPGDLRVVTTGEGCGTPGCHAGEHADWVPNNPFAFATGMFSGAAYTAGIENQIPAHRDLWQDTAADYAWRPQSDPTWAGAGDRDGTVGSTVELPERAVYNDRTGIYDNPLYDATQFNNYIYEGGDGGEANQIRPGTPLEHTYLEAIGITCGDCHLVAPAPTTASAISAPRAAPPATWSTAPTAAAGAPIRTSTTSSRPTPTPSRRPSAATSTATRSATWPRSCRAARSFAASATTRVRAATRVRTAR